MTQGRNLCIRGGGWKKRKEVSITCSSLLSHHVTKISNSPTDFFHRFLMQSVFLFKFQTLVTLKKIEQMKTWDYRMKSCHQILSLRKICSNTQRIFPNGRNGTRQSWRGKHSSTPHIPFPNSFISLMLNLKQMRGECNKTWMLNRVTLIQSPAILEFFFQQFSNSNIALALKMRKTVEKRPGYTIHGIYSKESSQELCHFIQL